jgi:hypothetical protein
MIAAGREPALGIASSESGAAEVQNLRAEASDCLLTKAIEEQA